LDVKNMESIQIHHINCDFELKMGLDFISRGS